MGSYILMNKHKKIAKLQVSSNNIEIIKQYIEMPKYLKSVEQWIYDRLSIVNRENTLRLARLAGIGDIESFINITKAISVTDTFWVNSEENPVNWDEINPYKNKISNVIANIIINGFNSGDIREDISSPSPQYRLDGSAEKCVKKVKDKIYLYKTCGEKWCELAGLRPYSEYFACQVMNKIGVSRYIKYDIKENRTEGGFIKPYSVCKVFTNESNGLVQISDTRFKGITEFIGRVSNKEQELLKEMVLADSIILNCDRHTGNYGFLVNNDTLKIKTVAPIYDNDCSLGSTTPLGDRSFEEAYQEIIANGPKPGFNTYNDMARWGMTKKMYDNLNRVGYIEIKNKFNGITERRRMFIEYIVNRRIKEILDMYKGGE